MIESGSISSWCMNGANLCGMTEEYLQQSIRRKISASNSGHPLSGNVQEQSGGATSNSNNITRLWGEWGRGENEGVKNGCKHPKLGWIDI